ncbi:hypothetical protein ERJ75_000429200 [Trypanosoma vivax]|uniref:Uncharacterized protein n=1 Tax=Trypanosoma vivax (strain Y486) TaxID=1055687 RepID=G0TZJ4_TRYVY|nr:hypothetical protein ERJ75_000429200 [Trypanosoma vivax]CCC50022.1 conserved hypothetical protein [Trypanosoma vivax Y486]
MADAVEEYLRHELADVLHQAKKQRDEFRWRTIAASDRAHCRHALARAEELMPLFRVDILRRARAIQKRRSSLLHTLRRYADVLPTGDIHDAHGCTNTEAVLSAVHDVSRVERQLGQWQQPRLQVAGWRAMCANASAASAVHDYSIGPDTRPEQRGALDFALEQLLVACDWLGDEENPEECSSWISIPYFRTVSDFCKELVLSNSDAPKKNDAGGGGGAGSFGNRESEVTDLLHCRAGDEPSMEEGRGVGVEGKGIEVTIPVLHAATVEIEGLCERDGNSGVARCANEPPGTDTGDGGGKRDGSGSEEDGITEELMEVLRLRVCIEIVARATACVLAVKSLDCGEDGVLFDGVAHSRAVIAAVNCADSSPGIATATIPASEVPVQTLVLPSEEQLFYCIAYTLGAAILRDECVEQHSDGNIVVCSDAARECGYAGDPCAHTSNVGPECSDGWRGTLGRWIEQSNASSDGVVGLRLLMYLVEFVFRPSTHTNCAQEAAVIVEPEVVRRWLVSACRNAPEHERTVNALLHKFTAQAQV